MNSMGGRRSLGARRWQGIMTTVILTLSLTHCAPQGKQWEPPKEQAVFAHAISQLPPEASYGRLRFAHLPHELPPTGPVASTAALTPVIRFEVRNRSLEEAAKLLAASNRFSSFTMSAIANRRVTLQKIGTIEEIAQSLATQADARVFVDHELRTLRFMVRGDAQGNNASKTARASEERVDWRDRRDGDTRQVRPQLYSQ